MRPTGLALALLLAAPALAQEGPKPAAPPAPERPKLPEFIGNDAIRKPDGMVVHFYKVNFIDAKLLIGELSQWKSPRATITAEGPTVVPVGGKTGAPGPPFQNTRRIEETEENWPILRRVLDMIDVQQGQVYIDAKIIEVTYTDDLRYGFEAHVKRSVADTFFQGVDIKLPNRLDAINQVTTTFREGFKYASFDYVMDLAAAGATTTVTSKPTVYVSQGETAVINVGDQEPIVQQQLQGNTVTATTILQPTGLKLEVTPVLIGRDVVRARISAEVSRVSDFRVTATSTNLQVVNPVISSRKADTVLTVPDGEMIVIGGLDQDFDRDTRTGIPFLMDIPIIGAAFGSTTKRKEHTELIFYITFNILPASQARIIRPPAERDRVGK